MVGALGGAWLLLLLACTQSKQGTINLAHNVMHIAQSSCSCPKSSSFLPSAALGRLSNAGSLSPNEVEEVAQEAAERLQVRAWVRDQGADGAAAGACLGEGSKR